MRQYIASEWVSASKRADIKLTSKDTFELDLVSSSPILVTGVTCNGEHIPIAAGQHHIHFKHKFEGFIELQCTSKADIGFRFQHRAAQLGEPMDDRTPPAPKEPTNILQQMRSVIKSELAANRESFLVNDTGLPGHEVDDDNDDFEEEMYQARKAQLDKLNKSPTTPEASETETEAPENETRSQPTSETPPAS